VTPCSVLVEYQRFGRPYCFSETSVSYRNATRRQNTEDLDFSVTSEIKIGNELNKMGLAPIMKFITEV